MPIIRIMNWPSQAQKSVVCSGFNHQVYTVEELILKGLVNDTNKQSVIRENLIQSVLALQIPGVSQRQDVTVSFDSGCGTEEIIAVMVEGLFDRPDRSLSLRMRLAECLHQALKTHYPKQKIEVLVSRFDPDSDAFMPAS